MTMRSLALFVVGVCMAMGSPTNAPQLAEAPSTEIAKPETRLAWNQILPWMKTQVKNNCKCAGLACNCCFKFDWLVVESCFGVEHVPSKKSARLTAAFNSQTVVNSLVSLVRTERQCGKMPAPLTNVNYCLVEKTDQKPNGVITLCLSLEIRMLEQTGANVQFRCIEFDKGKVTIGGMPEADRKAILNLQVDGAFKKAMEYYKTLIPSDPASYFDALNSFE